MKKVLVIAYYFPPAGGSGVQRTLKFVKYLKEFGWQPVVLTAKNADYPAFDSTLADEIPRDVPVYRSAIFEPYKMYRKLTGKSSDESTDIATLSLGEKEKSSQAERIAEFIRAALFVPDARVGWYNFAIRLGKKIIEREKIDLIYSSAPPYTTHLIGLKLQKFSRLPWVADFRDSWIGWLSTPQWRPCFSRAIEMRMEESVLRSANRMLTVSKGVKTDLLSRHQHLDDDRWILMTNGYDAADFADIRPKSRDDRILITYTGSMYGNRNPEFLLKALEELPKETADKFHIRLVGRVADTIQKRIHASSVASCFEIIPYVTHAESLAYLLASDYSLLIIDDAPANRGILTGKLFEYIGAGRPILALAPEGDASELIRFHQLGYVAAPKDVAAIKQLLLNIQSESTPESAHFSPNALQQFERKPLTAELAKVFDELVK